MAAQLRRHSLASAQPLISDLSPRTCFCPFVASSPLRCRSIRSPCGRGRQWTVGTVSRAGCRRLALAAAHEARMARMAAMAQEKGTPAYASDMCGRRKGEPNATPDNLLPALSAKLLLRTAWPWLCLRLPPACAQAIPRSNRAEERLNSLRHLFVIYSEMNATFSHPGPRRARRPARSDGKERR